MSDDMRERVAEVLRRQHFDGTGCGTNGSNACSNCFGPSPMTADEIADALLPLIAEARTEGAAEVRERVEAVASEWESDRDVCLAWIRDESKHVDPDHPRRLSDMADLLNRHAEAVRTALTEGEDQP
jgi:hypothetical protein